MKKIFFVVLIFAALFFIALPTSAIPNPAPIYCTEMGYTVSGNDCVFPDGQKCEQWAFYRGECGQSYKKELACAKSGESLKPGHKCCDELVPIGIKISSSNGACAMITGAWSICAPCGNGVCDIAVESDCNCSQDCGGTTTPAGPGPTSCNEPNEIWDYQLKKCVSSTSTAPGGPAINCPNGCSCNGDAVSCPSSQSGTVTVEIQDEMSVSSVSGESSFGIIQISIGKTSQGAVSIKQGNVEATTTQKLNVMESKVYMETSSGVEEVKIMPEVASLRAIERLGEIKNVQIELKQVGVGNSLVSTYAVSGEREVKVLGLFKTKMAVSTEVNAQTGETIKVQKPWWSFLAW